MKNIKRVAAAVGAAVLLGAFCLPMIFAFGEGRESQAMFRGALGIAIGVPVLAYIFLLVYRVFGRKKGTERMGSIENIIFDVGQVLVDFSWQEYLESFGFSKEINEKVAGAVFKSPVWVERDQGLLTEEEYVDKFVSGAPECEKEIRAVMARCEECIHVRDYAEAWVGYLKKQGYGVYILSNYSRYMLEKNRPQMTFLKHVDGEIFSCRVQQIKPNRDIFETLLGRFGLKAKSCVFIDDNGPNCEAAEKLGIHAIQFEGFDQAVEELKKAGIE